MSPDNILRETDFVWLGHRHAGKVRDVYEQGGRLVLIATDRMTGFDRLLAYVPYKGQVLNQISAFWFKHTEDIIPNHVMAVPDPNAMDEILRRDAFLWWRWTARRNEEE